MPGRWNCATLTRASRLAAETRGRRAETLAAWWLRCQGFSILAQRLRIPAGEIDLVARRGLTLLFVEVKARATEDAGRWALQEHRLRRVAHAAETLVARFGKDCTTVRIDAIIVRPWAWPLHLRGVWQGEWR